MNTADVVDHLATLRRIGGEPAHIEAKRATGDLPKSLRETLSAFSNTDGGILLLGVDEASGCQTIPLEDPATLRDDLIRMSRDDMVPALMITSSDEPDAPLTIAGLLAFGQFPQEHFPQLMVSVVVHAPTSDTGTRFLDNQTVRGSIPEMVDATISMIARNLPVRTIISEHGGRFDEVEYPLEGVREAVVNALMHRDYSPVTRGTQVQVNLYRDRQEVRSPGGSYGGVGIDDLGEEGISSSRNATLASLLSDTYLPSSMELVAENRSSGIPAILNAALDAQLPSHAHHIALVIKEGGRRYAQYVLDPAAGSRHEEPRLFPD